MKLRELLEAAWNAGWNARAEFSNVPLGTRNAEKPKRREQFLTPGPGDLADERLFDAAPELLAALKVAVETIRIWHNAFSPTTDSGEAWALYQASPEMQLITAAIAKAEGR